ncbi:MAG: SlyX family protein [Gammaproteobacteria bacterium]|nr:SlyX family protein [Gammaproteobacteria bacterium]
MSDAARLEALEIKCAHLERAVQELSDVMYRQSRDLDTLRERNERLARQLAALESPGAEGHGAPPVEIPPHY